MYSSMNPTLPDGSKIGEESRLIQKTSAISISVPMDGVTSISLSNRGIERIDVDGCSLDGNEDRQRSSEQPPKTFRVPSLVASLSRPTTTTIVRLDLSRNKLTFLPKEIFGAGGGATDGPVVPSCPVLEYLDVGRNALKGLPSEIGNCKRLKELVALSNKIRPSGFPFEAVVSLPVLEVLDLRWNLKMNSQSSRRRLEEVFGGADGVVGGNGNSDAPRTPPLDLRLSPDVNHPGSTALIAAKPKLSACDRDANELRSQLEPLSTPQLRKRLFRTFGVAFENDDESAYDRENIMQRLLRCYDNNSDDDAAVNERRPSGPLRTVRYERGVPLDPILRKELLDEMEAIRWPRTTRERPKISAEGYVILQRPPPSSGSATVKAGPERLAKMNNNRAKREAEKLKRFSGIWNKALEAIASIDEDFAGKFTALAVTMNFRGSPHIDTLNIAPFYGVSLGDFVGGKLCVECSATCVAEIDTRGKFAKVDGRFCHWVSDYEGRRYSLIYYITHGEVVPQTTAIFEPPHAGAFDSEEEKEKDGHVPEWFPPPVYVP